MKWRAFGRSPFDNATKFFQRGQRWVTPTAAQHLFPSPGNFTHQNMRPPYRQTGQIVLIVAGVLGLVYGSFSYTKNTHEAKLGPIELSVKEKQTVNVPVWAGGGGK